MPNPVLIPIEDVEITLTFPDGSTEPFTLVAPNAEGESIFFIDFVRLPILPNYAGANYMMQRGFYKYQFQAQYSYSDHQMNLFRLIAASNIELKIPPEFGDTNNYQTFDVLLENRRGVRNYLSGLAMAVPDQTTQEKANLVPAGSVTLNFIGKKPFTEEEMIGINLGINPDNQAFISFYNEYEKSSSSSNTLSDFWSYDTERDIEIQVDMSITFDGTMGGFGSQNTIEMAYQIWNDDTTSWDEKARIIITVPEHYQDEATLSESGSFTTNLASINSGNAEENFRFQTIHSRRPEGVSTFTGEVFKI